MTSEEVLEYLGENDAVLTNSHFIYTSGMHGTAYINMRAVAHRSRWLVHIGQQLALLLGEYEFDVVVGPETLGRTLAPLTARWSGCDPAVWCDIVEEDGEKKAVFSPKLDFGRLVKGKKVAVVDDLLTTGSSIRLVADLIAATGGEVVAAAAVVRRTSDVTAESCGVPALEVLADVSGFAVFTPEECAEHGPCSQMTPVVLRPGHGWKWIEDHPDYPTT